MSIQEQINKGMRDILIKRGYDIADDEKVVDYEEGQEWRGGGCSTCSYEAIVVTIRTSRNKSYTLEESLNNIIYMIDNAN